MKTRLPSPVPMLLLTLLIVAASLPLEAIGQDGATPPAADSRRMPSMVPCMDLKATPGKTTEPGSPGSQSGALGADDPTHCKPEKSLTLPGKTTQPGSRGTQGGATPPAAPGASR